MFETFHLDLLLKEESIAIVLLQEVIMIQATILSKQSEMHQKVYPSFKKCVAPPI